MKVDLLNMAGDTVGSVELPASIFEQDINRDLMHQALVRQLANARLGTHKAKSRSEISRTTAKWYRQKGTGRARHGSRRAPIFVGGGVAHGPRPRSYAQDMPRKMRRSALCSALSSKAGSGDIVVLDELAMERPKTRDMAAVLNRLVGRASALVLTAERDEFVEKSVRNLPEARMLRASYLNVRDVLGYQKLVMPLSALEVIQSYLGDDKGSSLVFEMVVDRSAAEEEE